MSDIRLSHKILTGRRDRIRTLRMGGGFVVHQAFGERIRSVRRAHSSTRFRRTRHGGRPDLKGRGQPERDRVIGDGAMSAGMAYEAMNNAGSMKSGWSSSSTTTTCRSPRRSCNERVSVGLLSSKPSLAAPGREGDGKHFPATRRAAGARGITRAASSPAAALLFRGTRLLYVGPIDGHNLDHCCRAEERARQRRYRTGADPRRDAKGPWLSRGEVATNIMASSNSTFVTRQSKAKSVAPRIRKYSQGAHCRGQARRSMSPSPRRCVRHGLNLFGQAFPSVLRCRIAEQHGVHLRRRSRDRGHEAVLPAIYSTFLQRGYDQVVMTSRFQSLPVRLPWTARLVGADGPLMPVV